MAMTIEKIKGILESRWSYKPARAEGTAHKLVKMGTDIFSAFEIFLESGEFPKFPIIFGITPLDMSKHYPFKPPAVFLTLDWIQRDPEQALEALVDEYRKPLPASFDSIAYKKFVDSIISNRK